MMRCYDRWCGVILDDIRMGCDVRKDDVVL